MTKRQSETVPWQHLKGANMRKKTEAKKKVVRKKADVTPTLELESDTSHGPVAHDSTIVFFDVRKISEQVAAAHNSGAMSTLEKQIQDYEKKKGLKPKKRKFKKWDPADLGDLSIQHEGSNLTFNRKKLHKLMVWLNDTFGRES